MLCPICHICGVLSSYGRDTSIYYVKLFGVPLDRGTCYSALFIGSVWHPYKAGSASWSRIIYHYEIV